MIDNHTHLFEDAVDLVQYWEDFANAGIDKIGLLCVSNPFDSAVNDNARGLRMKRSFPDRVFLLPGCEYSFDDQRFRHQQSMYLSQQVDRYAAIGVDGWKCLEGKPGYHKYDLSGPFYSDFLDALTVHQLPLLIHVGDPIEFWNADTLPKWAFAEWYYDDRHPSLEYLRKDALTMIEQHPDLIVVLPHFFFMSYELDSAADLLAKHPNVLFDLAPGVEMFFGFSSDREQAQAFFTTYQDRILFGTDRGVAEMPAEPRASMIMRFLTTADSFDPPHSDVVMWPDDRAPIRGIDLPSPVVDKITAQNFVDHFGAVPRALDEDLLQAELNRLREIYGS
ncbi:MAG: amidohydrolase family protein [Saprospiraceae bacterium]|nr:amidohydrolase family protein [Saprospiraceae bacterium]